MNKIVRRYIAGMLAVTLVCLGGCSGNSNGEAGDGSTMADSAAQTDDKNASETDGRDNSDLNDPGKITLAQGSSIRKEDLLKENGGRVYNITGYGALSGGDAVSNTEAVNAAIEEANRSGGGTVLVPPGDYKTYTIRLLDNVNIRIDRGGIIRAARTDLYDQEGNITEEGDGGNYDEPEVNLYAGLQDHGHSYFSNSLFYAADKCNICIYGEGLIDGSYIDDDTVLRSEQECDG